MQDSSLFGLQLGLYEQEPKSIIVSKKFMMVRLVKVDILSPMKPRVLVRFFLSLSRVCPSAPVEMARASSLKGLKRAEDPSSLRCTGYIT